jgi:glutamine amidotransferase-like uncharacterized protein
MFPSLLVSRVLFREQNEYHFEWLQNMCHLFVKAESGEILILNARYQSTAVVKCAAVHCQYPDKKIMLSSSRKPRNLYHEINICSFWASLLFSLCLSLTLPIISNV